LAKRNPISSKATVWDEKPAAIWGDKIPFLRKKNKESNLTILSFDSMPKCDIEYSVTESFSQDDLFI